MENYKIGYRDASGWHYFSLICSNESLMHMCITLLNEGCNKISVTRKDKKEE